MEAMRKADKILPLPLKTANKPWISDTTLEVIRLRILARAPNDSVEERRLHKEVRRLAKIDKTRWVDLKLSTADWNEIRRIQKPRAYRQGRLQNQAGEQVDSSEWAETMAHRLETVQWRVRPAALVEGPVLGAVLPFYQGDISPIEVERALAKLKLRRASGTDKIPAEYWKALADNTIALRWLTDLCNKCRQVPKDWSEAIVSTIYKKGPVDDCNNYRLISLLCVAYKIYASIIH